MHDLNAIWCAIILITFYVKKAPNFTFMYVFVLAGFALEIRVVCTDELYVMVFIQLGE